MSPALLTIRDRIGHESAPRVAQTSGGHGYHLMRGDRMGIVPELPAPSSKLCKKCGRMFPADREHFHFSKGVARSRCKTCRAAERAVYYAANSEQAKSSYRAWLAGLSEQERRELNARHAASVDKSRKQETDRARYLLTGPRSEDPVLRRVRHANNRAAAQGRPGTLVVADIWQKVDEQRGLCYLCGDPLASDFHIDHRTPLSRGGPNVPSNVGLSCPRCNAVKGTKLPHEMS